MVRVAGRAAWSDGRLASAVHLALSSASDLPGGLSTEAHNGEFLFPRVAPGKYSLTASTLTGEGYYAPNAVEQIDVGDEDVLDLRIPLEPVVEVHGNIMLKGSGKLDFDKLQVNLRRSVSGKTYGASGRVKSGGNFAMQAPAGSYRASVAGLGDDYLIVGVKNSPEAPEEMEEVRLAPGRSTITVVVQKSAARLEGRVVTGVGEPVMTAAVLLMPSRPAGASDADAFVAARTDYEGRFSIGGLAPGEYRLLAFDDLDPEFTEDPSFLRTYGDRATSVTLTARQRTQVHLLVQPSPME